MRKAEAERLRTLNDLEDLHIVNLDAEQTARLLALGFDRLTSLSLRSLRASDLGVLRSFPKLKHLEVWQSANVTSLEGIQHLSGLRWLSLSELGTLPSLEPLAQLSGLTELYLTGGVWKDQKLMGDFAPLAELVNLRRLTITNVRGPVNLAPLLEFEKLEHLFLATALFRVREVARIAARYEFFRRERPWLHPFDDRDGCPTCRSRRVPLLLQRTKRIFCERCDAGRLNRTLEDFEKVIREVAD